MTEAEWLACEEPLRLLDAVRYRVSLRKLRQFAAACCRQSGPHLPTEPMRRGALDFARFLDGSIARDELVRSLREALGEEPPPGYENLDAFLTGFDAWPVASVGRLAQVLALGLGLRGPGTVRREARVACNLLRELVAPPYRRSHIDPLWLRYDGGCVGRLAHALDSEQRWDELPVLADALEEVGCDDEHLLAHCRRAGGHRPGCWALDALLGRD
jgi:hypothetical protein